MNIHTKEREITFTSALFESCIEISDIIESEFIINSIIQNMNSREYILEMFDRLSKIIFTDSISNKEQNNISFYLKSNFKEKDKQEKIKLVFNNLRIFYLIYLVAIFSILTELQSKKKSIVYKKLEDEDLDNYIQNEEEQNEIQKQLKYKKKFYKTTQNQFQKLFSNKIKKFILFAFELEEDTLDHSKLSSIREKYLQSEYIFFGLIEGLATKSNSEIEDTRLIKYIQFIHVDNEIKKLTSSKNLENKKESKELGNKQIVSLKAHLQLFVSRIPEYFKLTKFFKLFSMFENGFLRMFKNFFIELPILQSSSAINRFIANNKIGIIHGLFGSGKSTEIPNLVLDLLESEKTLNTQDPQKILDTENQSEYLEYFLNRKGDEDEYWQKASTQAYRMRTLHIISSNFGETFLSTKE